MRLSAAVFALLLGSTLIKVQANPVNPVNVLGYSKSKGAQDPSPGPSSLPSHLSLPTHAMAHSWCSTVAEKELGLFLRWFTCPYPAAARHFFVLTPPRADCQFPLSPHRPFPSFNLQKLSSGCFCCQTCMHLPFRHPSLAS